MCSLNGGDLLLIKNDDTIKLDDCFCLKCKTEKASVKLRGSDVYCNSCFLTSVTHKFRATLGKSKIVRRSDKVLVAYSGESGSVALLNLIRAGMHESVHKRLVFETHVVHIDDGCLLNKTIEQRQARINEIITQTNSLDFKLFVTSIGEIFNEKNPDLREINNYTCSINDNDEKLLNIYNNLTDETSKKDFLHKIREKLIVTVAKCFDCCKIFFDEDSTSLAVTILSNVSLGRGAQLSSDVGFIDDRHTGVMILRPMRDFTRQELNYYMDIHKLNSFTMKKSSNNSYSSIQGVTESFVIDLDEQFGGTVAAIFRTGEKLSSKSKNNDDVAIDKCVMCEGYIDTAHFDKTTSAIEATNFSKIVSLKGSLAEHDLAMIDGNLNDDKTIIENGNKKCGDCSGSCGDKNNSDNDLSVDEINKHLCYACRRIFSDKKIINNYLTSIVNAIREKKAFENMRNEISDFLL
ncbi:cytoplasmic tRNA 2-thiolation protein 2 [Aphidius gifuensis]|uniref:cytoplasmic tRNA 2-thiolation protein 2 n=1 Tax=Aphidius gifuensis TaxID=684658 RepID=UPI001CDC5527|nr:cytoplasmic tRNA 2-thiolation protein 2 [Aphidius gifuensis]